MRTFFLFFGVPPIHWKRGDHHDHPSGSLKSPGLSLRFPGEVFAPGRIGSSYDIWWYQWSPRKNPWELNLKKWYTLDIPWLLVGGWATPLKSMKVNWDDEIPNIWENKTWQPNHQPNEVHFQERGFQWHCWRLCWPKAMSIMSSRPSNDCRPASSSLHGRRVSR